MCYVFPLRVSRLSILFVHSFVSSPSSCSSFFHISLFFASYFIFSSSFAALFLS
jgi:hypothetical protein